MSRDLPPRGGGQYAGGGESVPGPLGRHAGFRDAEDRQQAGRPTSQQFRRQQRQRVQIRVAAPQPPVQAARRAVERPRLHHPHDLTGRHPRTLGEQRAHRFVGGPQRGIAGAVHLDRHHSAPRHPAREGDPPRGRREHRRARRRGEVHAAMAARVGVGGRLPAPPDRGTPGERPGPIPARPRGRGREEAGAGKRDRPGCRRGDAWGLGSGHGRRGPPGAAGRGDGGPGRRRGPGCRSGPDLHGASGRLRPPEDRGNGGRRGSRGRGGGSGRHGSRGRGGHRGPGVRQRDEGRRDHRDRHGRRAARQPRTEGRGEAPRAAGRTGRRGRARTGGRTGRRGRGRAGRLARGPGRQRAAEPAERRAEAGGRGGDGTHGTTVPRRPGPRGS